MGRNCDTFVGAGLPRPLDLVVKQEEIIMYIIIVYDIGVKRVAKVCKYLRQHLNWVQNSVFEGELTKAQLARVKSGLFTIIDESEDSVLIYQMRHEKWMDKQVIGIEKNPVTNLL